MQGLLWVVVSIGNRGEGTIEFPNGQCDMRGGGQTRGMGEAVVLEVRVGVEGCWEGGC